MSTKNNTPKTPAAPKTPTEPTKNPTPAAINVDAIRAAVIANAHPAANLFPMMSGDEFQNLCLSMRQHGFDPSKPIKRSGDKVTDGRNREAAAQVVNAEVALWNADPKNANEPKAAVVPVYIEETSDNDSSILDTVLIDNLNRRHLSSSQKAAVLVKAGILGGAYLNKDKLNETGKRVAGDIAEMIAAQHGVNHDYIYKVKAISKTAKIGKKLLDEIASGEKSVMQAYAEIKKLTEGKPKEGDDNNPTPEDAILDGTKKPVAEEWKETFAVREKFAVLAKLIRDARAACKEIAATAGGQLLAEGNNLKEVLANFGDAAKSLRNVEPHVVCPHCDGTGKHPEKGDKFNCPVCAGLAFLTEPQHERYLKHGVAEETAEEGAAEGEAAKTEPTAAPAAPKGKGKKTKPEAAPAEATATENPAEATSEAAPAEGEPAAV